MTVHITNQIPAETHIGDIDKIPLNRSALQIRKMDLTDIDALCGALNGLPGCIGKGMGNPQGANQVGPGPTG